MAWLAWFGWRSNSQWQRIGKIEKRKASQQPTGGAYKSKHITDRFYIVTGGRGYRGSWIIRYLLARGEKNIHILDRARPPPDIMKPGVSWVKINILQAILVDREITKITSLTLDTSQVVVYNCSMVKKYDLSNYKADLGVQAAEALLIALRAFSR